MKLVQVFVPADDRAAVRETLEELEVEYLLTDADGRRDGVVASFPVPAGAVDAILDRLHDAGLDEDTYTVVTEADRAAIPNADELTERFVEGPRGELGASNLEVRERAEDLKPDTATYVAFAAASAVVAVGGLLLDSAIVIVGAMVIAPFAGSTLSASVGAVVGDRGMVVDSATSQVLGLVVAYVGAVAMGAFLQRTGFVPSALAIARVDQVSTFVTPNALTLAIAIAAGLAGALALATDLPVSIAGVAVAAAIVPAAATAGIGTVWGEPIVVLGATVLLLMNIVFINLAAYVALVSLGYRSSLIRSVQEDASLSIRSSAYAVVVLAFVVVFALTAVGTYQHVAFEQRVNSEVQEVLEEPEYRSLELVGVKTGYNAGNVLGEGVSVTVTVARTGDADYDRLAEHLRTNVSDATGRPLTTRVRFVDYRQARPTDAPSPSGSLLSRLRAWVEALRDRLVPLPERLAPFPERLTAEIGPAPVCRSGGPC